MTNTETSDNPLLQTLLLSKATSYLVRACTGQSEIQHVHLEIAHDARQVDHVCHQHVQRYSLGIVFQVNQDRPPSQHGAFLG